MGSIIKSISYSQDEILQSIVDLHTGLIQADVTFGLGNFYRPDRQWMNKKEIVRQPRPQFRFDIAPQVPGVIAADVRRLPIRSGSLYSVAFDPPFMARTGPGATLKKRFGELVGTIRDLWNFYFKAMSEIYRVLVPGGWLIMKCQDGVLSGVNNFTHIEVFAMSRALGFVPKDLFILLARHRMMHPKHQRQVHARKYHSYFWVLQKRPL